tara:strand:+ start:133962 stop:134279 length:318 start_codon:yes stop_codon:yes gene_type:complete
MKSSPQSGHELLTNVIKLINQGFGSHRCSIKMGMMRFENPHVQHLNLAINNFKKSPSAVSFAKIVDTIKTCESQKIESFPYDEIHVLLEQITKESAPSSRTKNKI